MKKLMIAIAAAIVGFAVNAATINWTAQCSWVSPDDDAALEGAKFYFFDENAYALATFSSEIGSKGADVFDNALGSGTVNGDGEVSFFGTGMTFTNDGSADWANGYGVIVADKGGSDYYFTVGAADPVKVTSAILAGGSAAFVFDDQITGEVGGAGWQSVAAPEPTSGLLLLLGVAGLALKRKRA